MSLPPGPDHVHQAGELPRPGEVEIDPAAFLPDHTSIAAAPPVASPDVELAALTRIEADLAAVDDALVAIDASQYERSPLLVELLAQAAPAPPT